MKKTFTFVFAALLIASMILSACATTEEATPEVVVTEAPVVTEEPEAAIGSAEHPIKVLFVPSVDAAEIIAGGELLAAVPVKDELASLTAALQQKHGAQVGLGARLVMGDEQQDIFIVLNTPEGLQTFARPYGGPPGNAPRYAVNHSLDLLRHL